MKILTFLLGKNHIAVSKPIYRLKKTTVLAFVFSCPLFMMTPITAFAHPKSCELLSNTAKAIMAFNTCKAEAQVAQLSGHSEEETQQVLEDELDRLRAENTLLRKEIENVRSTLFQLLQKLKTN